MAGLKVRLTDGSEVGPMDLAMVQTWFQQGLLERDSLVQKAGSPRWVRLREAVDLSRWGSSGGAARGRATRSPAASTQAADNRLQQRWRLFAAAALFWLLAAAALLAALRPDGVRPELDGVPWREIGLAWTLLGLLLAPGWRIGRGLARVLCVVAVAAAFPVAGLLIARSLRVEALLALTCSVVLACGFTALLARRLSAAASVAALLLIGFGGAGALRFARAEPGAALDVGTWATGERRISDPEAGLDLVLPPGWVALKPGNPFVAAPAAARVVLADPRVSGLALLLIEPAPPGVLALEHYLDDLIARRRVEGTVQEEDWRRDGRVGALASRRASTRRRGPEGRFVERLVVARDADRFFALVAWVPEAGAGRALDETEALEAAIMFSGVRSRREETGPRSPR